MQGGNINEEISFCWFKYKPRVKFMDGLKNGKMSVPLYPANSGFSRPDATARRVVPPLLDT